MTDACQASTHSPMPGAPSTEGYRTPSVTVTRPASRGPVTRAAVSASLLSPERDVIGVDQVTTTWMRETLRVVPSVFATGIQPAAAALGTIVSTESPLPSIKVLTTGRPSKEMGLLQNSIGPSATETCLPRHGDQTPSIS